MKNKEHRSQRVKVLEKQPYTKALLNQMRRWKDDYDIEEDIVEENDLGEPFKDKNKNKNKHKKENKEKR